MQRGFLAERVFGRQRLGLNKVGRPEERKGSLSRFAAVEIQLEIMKSFFQPHWKKHLGRWRLDLIDRQSPGAAAIECESYFSRVRNPNVGINLHLIGHPVV